MADDDERKRDAGSGEVPHSDLDPHEGVGSGFRLPPLAADFLDPMFGQLAGSIRNVAAETALNVGLSGVASAADLLPDPAWLQGIADMGRQVREADAARLRLGAEVLRSESDRKARQDTANRAIPDMADAIVKMAGRMGQMASDIRELKRDSARSSRRLTVIGVVTLGVMVVTLLVTVLLAVL